MFRPSPGLRMVWDFSNAISASQFSVEFTVAYGFCDMFRRDVLDAGQVRYRAGNLADFIVGTGAEAELGHRLL